LRVEGVEAGLRALEGPALTRIARAAVRSDAVEVTEWRWEPLRASLGIATAGLYRVHGAVRGRGGTALGWAAVPKVVRPPSGTRHDAVARDPHHWAYWKREPLAYGSGLLADLPGGLAAPRCLHLEERRSADGEAVWLWLEEVADRYGRWWPAERTLLAARHLGAFSGAYLERRPLPDAPWLGRGYLRQRIEGASNGLPLFDDEATWRHDLLRDRFDPNTGERLRAVWARRSRLLDALDRLPQTLCHGDCHRGNLFALPGPRSAATEDEKRTAAIHWGAVGIGPVGADLADLALSRAVGDELLAPGGADFGERLFGSYAEGLRAAGWGGEPRAARLGLAATAALAGTSRLHWTLVRALDARRRGALEGTLWRDADDVLRRWAALTRFFLALADEAA
jgi:hypothetical protein